MDANDPEDDLKMYTVQQVAKLMEVTVGTVRTWIKEDKLRAIKLDKQYRIPRLEVIKFINERYGA